MKLCPVALLLCLGSVAGQFGGFRLPEIRIPTANEIADRLPRVEDLPSGQQLRDRFFPTPPPTPPRRRRTRPPTRLGRNFRGRNRGGGFPGLRGGLGRGRGRRRFPFFDEVPSAPTPQPGPISVRSLVQRRRLQALRSDSADAIAAAIGGPAALNAFVAQMDADGDGRASTAEWVAFKSGTLDAYLQQRLGLAATATAEEWAAVLKGAAFLEPGHIVEALLSKVSSPLFEALSAALLLPFDANGDGGLSGAERSLGAVGAWPDALNVPPATSEEVAAFLAKMGREEGEAAACDLKRRMEAASGATIVGHGLGC